MRNTGVSVTKQTAGFLAGDQTSGFAGSALTHPFTKSTTTNGAAVNISSAAVKDNAGNEAAAIAVAMKEFPAGHNPRGAIARLLPFETAVNWLGAGALRYSATGDFTGDVVGDLLMVAGSAALAALGGWLLRLMMGGRR